MKKGDKIVAIVVFTIIIISFSFLFLYKCIYKNKTIATIKQDGVVIKKINLSSIKQKKEITIKTSDGKYNKVIVEPNKIRIVDADCPNKICVKQGWIYSGGQTIVCLPHKLIITIDGKSEVDDVTR